MAKVVQYSKTTRTKANRKASNAKPRKTRSKKA